MSKVPETSSIKPGSGATLSTGGASVARSSSSAGKQRQTDNFEMVGWLEEAMNMLEKIKQTAQNITCCENQIDQAFCRAQGLLEALLADSMQLDGAKVRDATILVDEAFKDFHKHALRFAIYGRPKAFVCRGEISSYFESFNVEMDKVLNSFAIMQHPDVQGWEQEYYQAKLEDEAASNEQLWEIMNNESDLKTIMELGQGAVDSLAKAIKNSIDFPHTPEDRKKKLRNAAKNIESHRIEDSIMMQPTILFKEPDTSRLSSLRVGPSTASSSSTSISKTRGSLDIPGESAAAKAKREEAEREREEARRSGEGMGWEDAPLPRWEPRRPPPGRGPGSIDGTMKASASSDSRMEPPPEEDLPPSYS